MITITITGVISLPALTQRTAPYGTSIGFWVESEFTSPPIHGINGLAFDNVSKANAIADTYERQFEENTDIEDEYHDNLVKSTVEEFFSTPPPHFVRSIMYPC